MTCFYLQPTNDVICFAPNPNASPDPDPNPNSKHSSVPALDNIINIRVPLIHGLSLELDITFDLAITPSLLLQEEIHWENLNVTRQRRNALWLKNSGLAILATGVAAVLLWSVEFTKQNQIDTVAATNTTHAISYYDSAYVTGVRCAVGRVDPLVGDGGEGCVREGVCVWGGMCYRGQKHRGPHVSHRNRTRKITIGLANRVANRPVHGGAYTCGCACRLGLRPPS